MELLRNSMLNHENLENARNTQHQDLLWPHCLFTQELAAGVNGNNGNGIRSSNVAVPLPCSQSPSSNLRRLLNSNTTTVSPPTPLAPVGFRFDPKPVELILHYLKNKIEGKPLPCTLITEIPLYKEHPESIAANFEKCNDEEWFFFTSTERRYKNGGRPNRCAVGGYWKATSSEKTVKNGNKIIGYKKILVFFEGVSGKGKKTNWILHEYRLEGSHRKKERADNMTLDEFVICKMYKRKSKSEKCQSIDYMEEEEDDVASQEHHHSEVAAFPNFDTNTHSTLPSSSNTLTDEIYSLSEKDFEEFMKELENSLER